MTTRAEKDKQNFEEIKTMLVDPKMGINNPSRRAIIQLFEHVILKKQVDNDILNRWRHLGRLTEDNVVEMDGKMFPLELALLSLEWDGKISFVQNDSPVLSK